MGLMNTGGPVNSPSSLQEGVRQSEGGSDPVAP